MTTGTETKGVQLYLLDATDSGNEVREITQIRSIGEATVSRAKIDITTLTSTEKEYLLGIADRASFPVGFVYDPQNASYTAMKALEGSSTASRFVIGLSDGTSVPTGTGPFTLPATRTWIDFNALVEAVNRGTADIDGAFIGTYTLAPTGGETETAKA